MPLLLDILHKNQNKWNDESAVFEPFSFDLQDENNDNDDRENFLVNNNFHKMTKEIQQSAMQNDNQQNPKTQKCPTTNLPMQRVDIGLKNFNVEGVNLTIQNDNSVFDNFAPNKKVLLVKFKRKNNEEMMSIDEIKKYVDIKNGNLVFLRKVSPEIIYKIAKSLNDEFFFAVNSQDNIIPFSAEQAREVFANKKGFSLNSNLHINCIKDSDGNVIKPKTIKSIFHDWFGKNVRHMHPYAYSDMVITKQVKHYKFVKKGSNGRNLIVKTQFSNELTGKRLSISNIHKLKKFITKCRTAYQKATTLGEEHVFALPFPLYDKQHMLSLVIAFKPNGEVNATIINANGRKDAKDRYAIPIGEILQKAFEEYAPHMANKVKYFFHENKSQFGGTCMTHADCITRQIAKDEDFEKDGHDIHPVKIWEKAYMRGFATTLFQHAKKQGMFIPDDVSVVKNDIDTYKDKIDTQYIKRSISNNIQNNKQTRNSYENHKKWNNKMNYNENDKFILEGKKHFYDKNDYYISRPFIAR